MAGEWAPRVSRPDETPEERRVRLTAWQREYRAKNRERTREYYRAYYRQHAERFATEARERRRRDPEHTRELARQRRARDPQKRKDQRRAWRLNNLDAIRAAERHRRHVRRESILEYERNYRVRNPTIKRAQHLRFYYGLELADYNRMRAEQDERCATCRTPFRPGRYGLHVDHDHVTGQVRALLCGHCNGALGWAREDPFLLRTLAAYLDYHAERQMPQREIAAA